MKITASAPRPVVTAAVKNKRLKEFLPELAKKDRRLAECLGKVTDVLEETDNISTYVCNGVFLIHLENNADETRFVQLTLNGFGESDMSWEASTSDKNTDAALAKRLVEAMRGDRHLLIDYAKALAPFAS